MKILHGVTLGKGLPCELGALLYTADSLVKKLEELSRNEQIYKGLMEHTHHMLKAFFDICHVYRGKHSPRYDATHRVSVN